MSFAPIEHPRCGRPVVDVPRVVIFSNKQQAFLAFSGPLVNRMGWGPGTSLLIETGSGSDAGRLRVSAVSDGARLSEHSKTHKRCSIPRRYLGEGAIPTTTVPHEIVDDSIIITLPQANDEDRT